MTGAGALEQYAETLQSGYRARAQLKRSVEAHQAAIGRLSAAELELQSAKQKAVDELQSHLKQLQQKLLRRYKQALALLEQEYELQQLPITSTTQLLQSSICALEQTVERLYLGLQQPSPAKSVQQYTSTMQEVNSIMLRAQAAVEHSQGQAATVGQHSFESIQQFKQLRVTSKSAGSPARSNSCYDVRSLGSMDTASLGLDQAYDMHARLQAPQLGRGGHQSHLHSRYLASPGHGVLQQLGHQHTAQQRSPTSVQQSSIWRHHCEGHDVQKATPTKHPEHQQQSNQLLDLLPDSWRNAPPPMTQQRMNSAASDFAADSNRQHPAAGAAASLKDTYGGWLSQQNMVHDVVRQPRQQHGQQQVQRSGSLQQPPHAAQPRPAATVAAVVSDTASWLRSLPGSSVMISTVAPDTPAAADSAYMSNVGSQAAASSDEAAGIAASQPHHSISTNGAVVVGPAATATDTGGASDSVQEQAGTTGPAAAHSDKDGNEHDIHQTWKSWRQHAAAALQDPVPAVSAIEANGGDKQES